MAEATRLYFRNMLDVPLWLIIETTVEDLIFHVYDHLVTDAVYIPPQHTGSHPVTPEIERFKVPKLDKSGKPVLDEDGEPQSGMDYWIAPHLKTLRAISTNDTRQEAGKVNLDDGPVISFYPVE